MEEAEKFLCSVSVLVQILHRVHVRFYCQLQPPVGICQKQNQSTDTCQGAWQQGNRSGVFTNAVSVLPRSMRNGIQLAYSVVKLSCNDKRGRLSATAHLPSTQGIQNSLRRWEIKVVYNACPVGIQPCTLKNRHSLKKIQDTRYKKQCTQDNDTSVPFQVGTLGPHTVLPVPSATLSYFPESHWPSEICSLSKVILVLGKARSCRASNLGCRGAESSGCFDVSPKKICIRCDTWVGALWW